MLLVTSPKKKSCRENSKRSIATLLTQTEKHETADTLLVTPTGAVKIIAHKFITCHACHPLNTLG